MRVYLDHNATTFISPTVANFVTEYLERNEPINPSSVHFYGRKGKGLIDDAKRRILKALFPNRHSEYDLLFVSSCTEANNQIISSHGHHDPHSSHGSNGSHGSSDKGIKALASVADHLSVIQPTINIGGGLIKCDPLGRIKPTFVAELMGSTLGKDQEGFLVSICGANSETGVVQEIESLSKVVKGAGGFFHVDCAQLIGKEPFNFESTDFDYITLSGHKIGAPQGVGALIYKQNNNNLRPLMFGGGQQKGLRAGTISPMLSMCLCLAIEEAVSSAGEFAKKCSHLRKELEDFVLGHNGAVIAHGAQRLANTVMLSMPNISSETQLANFDLMGFAVSAGAACSSGLHKKSHLGQAMGSELWGSAIRVSLGKANTQSEIEAFCAAWLAIRDRLTGQRP